MRDVKPCNTLKIDETEFKIMLRKRGDGSSDEKLKVFHLSRIAILIPANPRSDFPNSNNHHDWYRRYDQCMRVRGKGVSERR